MGFFTINCLCLFLFNKHCISLKGASLVVQRLKHLPPMQETRVRSLGPEDPCRRAWQSTPVFLLGESLRQRSLASYSPQGRKESDMTERLHFTSFHISKELGTLRNERSWHALLSKPVLSGTDHSGHFFKTHKRLVGNNDNVCFPPPLFLYCSGFAIH